MIFLNKIIHQNFKNIDKILNISFYILIFFE